jgi:hypothetical protein
MVCTAVRKTSSVSGAFDVDEIGESDVWCGALPGQK